MRSDETKSFHFLLPFMSEKRQSFRDMRRKKKTQEENNKHNPIRKREMKPKKAATRKH